MYDYGIHSVTSVTWADVLLVVCYFVFATLGIILFLKIWRATNHIKDISRHISEINKRQEEAEKRDHPEENEKPALKYAVEDTSDPAFPETAAMLAWIAFVGIIVAYVALMLNA